MKPFPKNQYITLIHHNGHTYEGMQSTHGMMIVRQGDMIGLVPESEFTGWVENVGNDA